MKLGLGPWLPDAAMLQSPALAMARNCLPSPGFYRPLHALAPVARRVLLGEPRGLVTPRLLDGALWQIAGIGGRLYRVPGRALDPVDVGREVGGPYEFALGERWRFTQYNEWLIATNLTDEMQGMNLVDSGRFEDLSTEAPRARFVTVVRDQIIAGWIDDEDGLDAYKLRWSGFTDGLPDPTAWAYSAEKLIDFQRVSDVGVIRGLTGGEFGTVLCDHGIVRMSFVGSPDIFQFDTVERAIGCMAPGSVVQQGVYTYFLAAEGFMRFDGARAEPIGRERIDRWFFDDFLAGNEHLIWAVADSREHAVLWLYPGQGSIGRPNRLLIYSPVVDQWSVADVTADLIGPVVNFGTTLDDVEEWPNLDTDPRQLDDPRLWAESAAAGGIVEEQLCGFGGTGMPAFFTLAEVEPVEGRRAALQRAVPLHEGGIARLRVGRRERQAGRQDWSDRYLPQADGVFRLRECARYHQLAIELSDDWQRAQGVEIDAAVLGGR